MSRRRLLLSEPAWGNVLMMMVYFSRAKLSRKLIQHKRERIRVRKGGGKGEKHPHPIVDQNSALAVMQAKDDAELLAQILEGHAKVLEQHLDTPTFLVSAVEHEDVGPIAVGFLAVGRRGITACSTYAWPRSGLCGRDCPFRGRDALPAEGFHISNADSR